MSLVDKVLVLRSLTQGVSRLADPEVKGGVH
jgi:hypothetical protein